MKLIDIAVGLMRGIGARLVAEKKVELARNGNHADSVANLEDRDLVTVLVKAHMISDELGEPLLSEDDILSRKCNFTPAIHPPMTLSLRNRVSYVYCSNYAS